MRDGSLKFCLANGCLATARMSC